MSKRLFTILLVGALFASLAPVAFGDCFATTANQVAVKSGSGAGTTDPNVPASFTFTGAGVIGLVGQGNVNTVAEEGLVERLSDVIVYDGNDALGAHNYNCFVANQTIRLTYNVKVTSPDLSTAPFTSAVSSNFDVYDTAGSGGLVISATSTVGLAPNQTPQTVITVTVLQSGTAGNPTTTATGAAFRIKNLRADVSGLQKDQFAGVTVSNTIPGVLIPVVNTGGSNEVAQAEPTVAGSAGVTANGAGLQSSGATLSTPARFTFSEGFGTAFRVPEPAGAQVLNDIATGATSLVFDIGALPTGVTVTFPSTIVVTGAGTGNVSFALRTGGTCTSAASCFAIYDTVTNDPAGAFSLTVNTAATATPGTATVNPTVAVNIGASSGIGVVPLHAFFGPAVAADPNNTNDDVKASAIPRYIQNSQACVGCNNPPKTRNIFQETNFFTITAVRTTLLYPFASTFGNFNTGISVANTGNDKSAFATTSAAQTGGIKFFFFQAGAATPLTLNTDLTTGGTALPSCRGLNASGQVAPGSVFACPLTVLYTAAGGAGTFDGYVIAVASFNFAHGFSAQFNGSGAPFAANNALVLGSNGRNDNAAEGLNQ